jgi:hypothetical protein
MVHGNLLILSYWTCWFFYSISGSSNLHVAATAATTAGTTRNSNFRGSGSTGTKRNNGSPQQQQQQQQLPVAKGGGTTRKKEDKEDAVGEDPTASNTTETTTTTTTTTVELLPFSLLINGSIEDEFNTREELQDYLLDYYWEQEKEEEEDTTVSMSTIDSIKLEMISHTFQFNGQSTTFFEYKGQAIIVRSIQQQEQQEQEGNNDIDNNGNIQNIQTKALENTEELQGYFLKLFALQHDVVAAGENNDKEPIVLIEVQVNDNPTIYIDSKETLQTIESILADTDADADADADDPNTANQDNSNASSDDDEIIGVDEIDSENDQKNPTASNANTSSSSNNNNKNDSSSTSIWKITVSIGCVMMILAGTIGVLLICREKRHRYNDHLLKGKLSGGRELDDDLHAVVDVISSDVDPDEQPEAIIYDKSILRSDSDEGKKRSIFFFFLPNFLMFRTRTKSIIPPVIENENETMESNINANPTSNTGSSNNNRFADKNRFDPSLFTSKSTAIDLTVPARNSKGFEDTAIEKEMPEKLKVNISPQDTGRSKKSSFTFSPTSFLHKLSTSVENISPKTESNATSQHNPEEGDSVVGKMNIYDVTSNDDDSMMGYSLASHEEDNVNDPNKESLQNINNECIENKNDAEDLNDSMSDESSQSSKSPRNPLFAGIHKILDMPNHSNNLSPDTIEIPPAVKSSNNIPDNENNMRESDDDTSSSYKEDDSTKRDVSSIMSGISSAGISDNDLKYHDTMAKNKSATPSEEVRGGSFVLPMGGKRTISNPTLGDVLTPDDASDAPSDERNNGLINAIANSNLLDNTIANSNLLDSDPTLTGHLVKEQRDIKYRTRKRREDRKQPPLTMEI